MVCPKFNSQVYKLRRWDIVSKFGSILQLNVPEKLPDGPMNMALFKEIKKNYEHTHGLINMNHT